MARYVKINMVLEWLKIIAEAKSYTVKRELCYEYAKILRNTNHTQEIVGTTADVAEVKHGYSISKMHYSDEFICSECGLIMRDCCRYVIDEDADGDESCYEFEFRYCPNCGAKMDGK